MSDHFPESFDEDDDSYNMTSGTEVEDIIPVYTDPFVFVQGRAISSGTWQSYLDFLEGSTFLIDRTNIDEVLRIANAFPNRELTCLIRYFQGEEATLGKQRKYRLEQIEEAMSSVDDMLSQHAKLMREEEEREESRAIRRAMEEPFIKKGRERRIEGRESDHYERRLVNNKDLPPLMIDGHINPELFRDRGEVDFTLSETENSSSGTDYSYEGEVSSAYEDGSEPREGVAMGDLEGSPGTSEREDYDAAKLVHDLEITPLTTPFRPMARRIQWTAPTGLTPLSVSSEYESYDDDDDELSTTSDDRPSLADRIPNVPWGI
jgi:hypothetical protein